MIALSTHIHAEACWWKEKNCSEVLHSHKFEYLHMFYYHIWIFIYSWLTAQVGFKRYKQYHDFLMLLLCDKYSLHPLWITFIHCIPNILYLRPITSAYTLICIRTFNLINNTKVCAGILLLYN